MNNSPNTIPAVEKTMEVMTALGNHSSGATQQELVTRLGLSYSSCYRILRTLQNGAWVTKGNDGRFRLGEGFLIFARSAVDPARRFESCRPVLERLAGESGLCAKLSVRRGGEQLTVLRAESPRPVSVTGREGAAFPVIEGSVGAALLADVSAEEIELLARNCREEIPERNRPELVLERIRAVQNEGFTLNMGVNRWRIDAMSVPVRDGFGTVAAALTLLGYDEDFRPEEQNRLFRLLRRAAAECAKIQERG